MARRSQLTRNEIAYIKSRLLKGDLQHDIAAALGINQGRVSEVNTGKRGADVSPSRFDRLESHNHVSF